MPARMDAQRSLSIPLSLSERDLVVEVRDLVIQIANPTGAFRVSYTISPGVSQLVLQSEWWSKSAIASNRLAQLRARAWRLANDKAVALGWLEQR